VSEGGPEPVRVIELCPGDILLLPGMDDDGLWNERAAHALGEMIKPLHVQMAILPMVTEPWILRRAADDRDQTWLLNPAGGGQVTPRGDGDAVARA
jgi:hypothetical protein